MLFVVPIEQVHREVYSRIGVKEEEKEHQVKYPQ